MVELHSVEEIHVATTLRGSGGYTDGDILECSTAPSAGGRISVDVHGDLGVGDLGS